MHPDLYLDEDDICFCFNSDKCGWKKRCFRHASRIKHPDWLHSFSDFSGGKMCPKWRKEHKDDEVGKPEHN